MNKALGYRLQAAGTNGSASVPASTRSALRNTQSAIRNPQSAIRNPQSGFTLPELLIALTIFITVAGGIALLFTGSIRTVKVGHANIDINEHIRAAMDLIETDLTQAFTSRDYGDYYTFYGTPIGMTFVGLVRPSRNAAQPNLSRVTYVLYGGTRAYGGRHEGFTSYEDYANSLPDNAPVTYQLLRYVEPNQDNLESFPVPWHLADDPNNEDPTWGNVSFELAVAVQWAVSPPAGRRQLCEPGFTDCVDEIVKAKKRELWLRMLAGDVDLPPFWFEDGNDNGPSLFDYLLVEDVVLVGEPDEGLPLSRENIVLLATAGMNPAVQNWPDRARLAPGETGTYNFQPFFFYGACCVGDGQPAFYPFWNDQRNMIGTTIFQENDGISPPIAEGNTLYAFGSPMAPRIPMMVDIRMQFLLPSPYAGAPDLFRIFTKQIDVPSGYTRTDLTG